MSPLPELPAWAADLLGEDAVVVDVFGGGTSRATLLLEVPPEGRRVVARHDSGTGPLSGTGFTLAREAAMFDFASGAGIPAPRPIALAADGRSLAVEEVPGTPEAAAEALDDYLGVLGRLHALPIDALPSGFPGLDPEGREDLQVWETLVADRIGRPVPLLDHAFARLHAWGYDTPSHVVLCHGDAGPGNYLHDGEHVTGLIDWEMAHTGDPHDDLASIAVRATLNGIDLGDYQGRIDAHWAPAAGRAFDPHRYAVAVVAVLARMVASCHAALRHRDAGQDRSVQLMGLPLMEIHLLRTAAHLDRSDLPAPPDAPADPEMLAEMAALVAEGLRHRLVPAADGGADGRARRLRYVAEQLAAALDADGRAPAGDPRSEAGLEELWEAANRRLAAFPAARGLAATPIPGTT